MGLYHLTRLAKSNFRPSHTQRPTERRQIHETDFRNAWLCERPVAAFQLAPPSSSLLECLGRDPGMAALTARPVLWREERRRAPLFGSKARRTAARGSGLLPCLLAAMSAHAWAIRA